MIPYGRQFIDEDDVKAVMEVLRSDYLTTGPKVADFENTVAAYVGAAHAVAVSSGTAALHACVHALGIGPGDEVIVPPMTFAATANAAVFEGATPVFCDVDRDTLLLDPALVEAKINPRTKAIFAVDFAGQPCDYEKLRVIAEKHSLWLVDDACHALGAAYRGTAAGALAHLNAFSFHPVKHITTGEGGMVTTADAGLAERMRTFRSHGITTDYRKREAANSWFYEMVDIGYNYRITDFQCALGLAQLAKLPRFLARRREIARRYDAFFAAIDGVEPLRTRDDVAHAYHLYVVKLDIDRIKKGRDEVFAGLRGKGIGVNVHYIPVHLHPYYRKRFGTGPGLCPVAEWAYERIISLPMYPSMTDDDIAVVCDAVKEVVHH